jgi:hypothetical protein
MKKLTLTKDTLRSLEGAELQRVEGAFAFPKITQSPSGCLYTGCCPSLYQFSCIRDLCI